MQLNVIDGNGSPQVVCVQSVGLPIDRSGTITAANASQQLLAVNGLRSGWLLQNQSDAPILVNDLGGNPLTTAIIVWPGQSFPPPNYPVTTGIVNIACTEQGAAFAAREY